MSMQTSPLRHRAPLTGRRVLNMLIGFFGFIVVVNGVFIYFALQSWPGLSTRDAYRKGLAYNEILNASQRQKTLGWRSAVDFGTPAGEKHVLRVRLKDSQSRGLDGLDVSVRLARPNREEFDQTVVLLSRGGGLYQAPVALPLKGRWHATIKTRAQGKTQYRMTHELIVN